LLSLCTKRKLCITLCITAITFVMLFLTKINFPLPLHFYNIQLQGY
jgi:hypothetical protein